MTNQKLKSLLLKAQSNSKTPRYKRVFVSANGNEYRFRPLSTELMDPNEVPFKKVNLHGGYKHPNYDGKYTSNFACVGKDCPMCKDARALKKVEYENNVPKNMQTGWKKQKNRYSLIWGINREDNELTLFLIPDTDRFVKVKDPKEGEKEWKKVNTTCHEVLYQKLMNAAESNQNPFNYKGGNDIVINSKKVDNKTNWDIYVDSETNDVDEKILEKFKEFPKLDTLYTPYSKEELEYIVKGKPYDKNLSKQKKQEEKEEFENESEEISNEDFDNDEVSNEEESSEPTDEEKLLNGDESLDEFSIEEDDQYEGLSDTLTNILGGNKE